MLATLEQRSGDLSGLVYVPPAKDRPDKRRPASLGDTALPLIAYLTCRPRTGPAHDELIARLGKFLLAMQRPDGGFHPRYDLDAGAPIPGPDPMYAAGQAVYALALLEGMLAEQPHPDARPRDRARRRRARDDLLRRPTTGVTPTTASSSSRRTGTAWAPARPCRSTATPATSSSASTTSTSSAASS
jgi:hypothetical protein